MIGFERKKGNEQRERRKKRRIRRERRKREFGERAVVRGRCRRHCWHEISPVSPQLHHREWKTNDEKGKGVTGGDCKREEEKG